jgi:divalent metal cation (Fe/Co/Zn/Cd) transporter
MDRAGQLRRGVSLEWLTLGYNSLEALVALIAGAVAGSVALVGFGLDSLIEVTSGATLLWRLRSDSERSERIALKVVGVCFLALAAYVGFEASESLLFGRSPERSIGGVLLAIASLVVMPMLARAKRRVAGHIGSAALSADAKQTELCAYLSAILLVGLALNAMLGWWWADPLAALAMVPIMVKEGVDALGGKTCCPACH